MIHIIIEHSDIASRAMLPTWLRSNKFHYRADPCAYMRKWKQTSKADSIEATHQRESGRPRETDIRRDPLQAHARQLPHHELTEASGISTCKAPTGCIF
jgi:hypothetical protein